MKTTASSIPPSSWREPNQNTLAIAMIIWAWVKGQGMTDGEYVRLADILDKKASLILECVIALLEPCKHCHLPMLKLAATDLLTKQEVDPKTTERLVALLLAT